MRRRAAGELLDFLLFHRQFLSDPAVRGGGTSCFLAFSTANSSPFRRRAAGERLAFLLFPPPTPLRSGGARRGNVLISCFFHRRSLRPAAKHSSEPGAAQAPGSLLSFSSQFFYQEGFPDVRFRRVSLMSGLYLITSSVSLSKRCIFAVLIASSIRSSTLTSISAGTLDMIRLPLYSM